MHAIMPPGAALLAAGGDGRAEPFPHSDVDVLVLLPPTADMATTRPSPIEGFITACWDIGLEIGSSVRTVDETPRRKRTRRHGETARLEPRFLCARAARSMPARRVEAIDPRAFLRAKTPEMRQRDQKFEDTPHPLEPNCKESPGGLWICKW